MSGHRFYHDSKINVRMMSARQKAGLTLAQAAKAIGTKAENVAKWECGEAQPQMKNLRKAAELYGCTVSDLTAI